MRFYADLHIHSKYSRATSRDCDLEHLAWWARRKGIAVVGTGDFTHPAWFEEIRSKLVPAEPGLFRLRPEIEREIDSRLPAPCRGATRFMLEVEISTIYKKGDKTRKVHHLIYAATLETAARFREALGKIGNINSDGRPILGLDSRHLLEITLESGPDAYLIPAHIWTPWFAVLGSKSGFDAVEDCYGDLSEHIFAVETGLSSDPPMNWRVSGLDRFRLVSNSDAHSPPMLGREASVFDTDLDYFAMRRALESGEGFGGTVEFFPEEGKYHMDGHRACAVRLQPAETRRLDGRCPQCGKPLTVGVLHRVEHLADRPEGEPPPGASPFRSLVPLPEIVGEIRGVGAKSKTVAGAVASLVDRLGPELTILEQLPVEDVERAGDTAVGEALRRLRAGKVRREPGYDGAYGTIHLFAPGELAAGALITPLFGRPAVPEPSSTTAPPIEAAAPPRPVAAPEPLTPTRTGLDALDPEQRVAAEIVEGPLLIVAGPGTGKTHTLTHRIAHLVRDHDVDPAQCLALTFTRRAAEEMGQRLDALVPDAASALTVATFHGLGLTILREQRQALGLHRGFRIADETERLALAAECLALSPRQAARRLADLDEARRARAAGDDESETAPELTADLERYAAALRDRNLVDLDDLLLLPVTLLAAQKALRDSCRARFRWLFIDEYQDIDPLQYRLVRLLAPPAGNVCAIGDPDQSIYRFRGAEVGFFLRFSEDFPTARRVELGRNYRSSQTIVEAALQAIAPASLVPARRLRAVDEAAAAPIVLHEAPSDRAEAEFVVHTIEQLLGGTSYFSLDSGRVGVGDGEGSPLAFDDFAVLYRTRAQAALLVEALGRSGIPFQQRSHERLRDHPAVQALLPALRARLDDARGDSGDVLAHLSAAAASAEAEAQQQDENKADAAIELLTPLARRHGNDLEAFLAALALGAEVDTWDPRAERVSLLTLHAAKGLEFPVVFLVGCEDGLLPYRHGGEEEGDEEAIAEERRLFFVGLTRARTRLYLSHARRRLWRGQVRERRPSPFLHDIEEALLARRRAVKRPKGRGDGEEGPSPQQLRLL